MESMERKTKLQYLRNEDISVASLFQSTDGNYLIDIRLSNGNVISIWTDMCRVAKQDGGNYTFGALEIEDGKWGI